MTSWQLTVCVAREPSPIVKKLIDLAGRRPLTGGNDITVAKFNYETKQDAMEASKRIENAGLGAFCRVRSFDKNPSLSDVEEEICFEEWEELEEQRREKVIHKIGLRNAAGRMEDIP